MKKFKLKRGTSNMFYSEKDDREKRLRFSIRKVSFGAASVAVAALYLFMGSGAVSAEEAQAVQSNEEVAADKDSETEEQQPTYAAPAAKEQGSATNTEAGDEGKQESHPETKEEEANSSERSETTTKTQSDEDSVSGDSSSPKSEGEGTRSEEASSKPKVRKRRDAPAPPATATDEDLAANQTYDAPGDDASVDELATKLKELPATVENEKKLGKIDEVGTTKNIAKGEVGELTEFGGWKAVSAEGKEGKFAVARKTADGVFPIETVNVTRNVQLYTAHVEENSFDRSHEYILLLSQVRTYATRNEETFDKSDFKDIDQNRGHGEAKQISKGLKGFNGIEKTYKAYSSSTGTGVNISFKTGFTGDIDGYKAGYKVEVIAKLKDGSMRTIYQEEFRPDQHIDDMNKKVVPVDANDGVKFAVSRNSSPSTESLNQKLVGYKNNQGTGTGTFTSKNIVLPKDATEYTVRIAASDNLRLGMGYQVPWKHYALPIVGTGFSVTQDTSEVAKNLSQKVYDKLTQQKEEDTKWSTPATKADYQEKLNKIKGKIDSGASTSDYRTVVKDAVEKWKQLNEGQKIKDKAKKAIADKLTEKEEAIENNSNLSPAEKEAAKKEAKAEADKAKQAIEN
ncbi:YSIRK-type signal peptide-containing protein, partial [Streptococcus pseudopneumoniae]|uniref:YSIRK-type signal peptide-containing protein n=1 Tax=Streptococcus pseudopneumoniae TaxID=257758 RepID=UPI0013E371C4